MRRREFIGLIGVAAAASKPRVAFAQQQPLPLIGIVTSTRWELGQRFLERLREGLGEYGYVEGQNFRFELREANFKIDRIPILTRELVDQKVSVIIADTTVKAQVTKAATQSIPIVIGIGADPVENGFVASFNKPGGNITGVFNLGVMLTGKQLEILHELVPSAKTIALLTDPGNATTFQLTMPLAQAAADRLGLGLLHVEAHTSDEIEAAVDTAARGGAGAILVGSDAFFQNAAAYKQLIAVAARYRLPTLFVVEAAVKAGGLISYGSDHEENWRMIGRYVARILRGEKPADLPVEQSTKTILSINLKTAEALGITVPQTLLARAEEVIE